MEIRIISREKGMIVDNMALYPDVKITTDHIGTEVYERAETFVPKVIDGEVIGFLVADKIARSGREYFRDPNAFTKRFYAYAHSVDKNSVISDDVKETMWAMDESSLRDIKGFPENLQNPHQYLLDELSED